MPRRLGLGPRIRSIFAVIGLAMSTPSATIGVGPARDEAQPLTLCGRVVDAATKQPIAGAIVTASITAFDETPEPPADGTKATTGADGRFSLCIRPNDARERRSLVVSVRHPDYIARKTETKPIALLVAAADKREKPFCDEVTLESGIVFTAEVATSEGVPASGTAYEFWNNSAENVSPHFSNDLRGTADEAGKIRLRMPQSKVIQAMLTHEAFAPFRYYWDANDSVRYPDGTLPTFLGKFLLDPGVTLSGRAIGVDGKPIGGLDVVAFGPSEGVRRLARTNASGEFTFPPLRSGDYTIGALGQMVPFEGYRCVKPTSARPIRPVTIHVEKGMWSWPILLSECPSVSVSARFVDTAGKPARGDRVWISGSITAAKPEVKAPQNVPPPKDIEAIEIEEKLVMGFDGESAEEGIGWGTSAEPDAEGRIAVRVPKDLAGTSFTTSDSTGQIAYTTRLKPGDEPTPGGSAALGTVESDMTGIEIRAHRSPSILVRIEAEGGWPDQEVNVVAMTPNGQGSEISERQGDGRFRLAGILPDRPYIVHAAANGYVNARVEGIQLAEGSTTEVALTLMKQPKPAEVGDLAPPILVTALDGKSYSSADFIGRYVLVSIWSAENNAEYIKTLRAVQERFGKDKRFAMLSLSYDSDCAVLAKMVKDEKLDWPVARMGAAYDLLQAGYGWNQYPSSFLIGPDGHILAKDIEDTSTIARVAGVLE